MRSIARAPHYRRAERLLRICSGGVCGASHASLAASGPTPCAMCVLVYRRGLFEIERSPFRESDGRPTIVTRNVYWAFVWFAARANVIIVTLRFVKLIFNFNFNFNFFFCHVGFCCTTFTRRCLIFVFYDPWEIINVGTAALARYNNYAAQN